MGKMRSQDFVDGTREPIERMAVAEDA